MVNVKRVIKGDKSSWPEWLNFKGNLSVMALSKPCIQAMGNVNKNWARLIGTDPFSTY